MKKIIFTCILVFYSIILCAQNFQKGYYIDNSGTKIEGFINNRDWKNNPKSFDFKSREDQPKEIIKIDDCIEFSVETNRFIKAKIKIDRSSDKIGSLRKSKNPIFVDETVFLKFLISGTHNLYYYFDNGIEKFFFSNTKSEVQQLVYLLYTIDTEDVTTNPEYKNNKAGSILANEAYKKQLLDNVTCDLSNVSDINKLEYTRSDLQKYFIKINSCNGSSNFVESVSKRTIFSVKLSLNANKDGFKYNSFYNDAIQNNQKVTVGIGTDLELIFPFNNYKWSFFIEPNYAKYQSNQAVKYEFNNTLSQNVSIDLSILQVPIGFRYYFGKQPATKLYLGGGMIITNLKNGSKIDFERSSDQEVANFSYNFFGSIGYKYKRFVAEIRFNKTYNIAAINFTEVNFNRTSFSIKYEFLRK